MMDPQGQGILKDKSLSYFFVSVPVGKDTVDIGLDFDLWMNCWFYNPAQPSDLISKVLLENQQAQNQQVLEKSRSFCSSEIQINS